MDESSFDISVIALVVSVLTLLFTIATYIIHDRKIKTQELKLINYQLKQIEHEKEQLLVAKLESSLSPNRGSRTLTTINYGKSPARNVRIEIISESDSVAYLKKPPHPILKYGEKISHPLHLVESNDNSLTIRYYWDDDSGNNREDFQVLSI